MGELKRYGSAVGGVKMKCIYSMVVGLLTVMPLCVGAVVVSAIIPNSVIAADKIVKTQVTGTGKTKGEAESDARNTASMISFMHRTVSSKTSGSGSNWVCTMIIEYTEKK